MARWQGREPQKRLRRAPDRKAKVKPVLRRQFCMRGLQLAEARLICWAGWMRMMQKNSGLVHVCRRRSMGECPPRWVKSGPIGWPCEGAKRWSDSDEPRTALSQTPSRHILCSSFHRHFAADPTCNLSGYLDTWIHGYSIQISPMLHPSSLSSCRKPADGSPPSPTSHHRLHQVGYSIRHFVRMRKKLCTPAKDHRFRPGFLV